MCDAVTGVGGIRRQPAKYSKDLVTHEHVKGGALHVSWMHKHECVETGIP